MNNNDAQSNLDRIINVSINLELAVSEIYFIFYRLFPEDADFWWQLVEEEKNHASLLRSGKEYFKPINKFPDKLVTQNLAELEAVNEHLMSLISEFSETPPDRITAFTTALLLEQNAGELHYQMFMANDVPKTAIDDIFIKLNRDDTDHARRLRDYMSTQGIPLPA